MRSYFSLLGILRLIATLPLFVIFLISSWYLIFQYNLGMNLKELRHEFSIALDLANLSKELDKEMIINDTNSKNVNRQITDHTIEHIKQLHSNELGLSEILNRLESLSQIRYTLDDANLNNSEVLSYFRDLNLLIKALFVVPNRSNIGSDEEMSSVITVKSDGKDTSNPSSSIL